jgi:hypothetical protein
LRQKKKKSVVHIEFGLCWTIRQKRLRLGRQLVSSDEELKVELTMEVEDKMEN